MWNGGAVAYLAKSQYGADGEIWNNSYNSFMTGCSGRNERDGNYSICVSYNTESAQKASTTYNIYGVYDMSGGAWDRVMGNYNKLAGDSGFSPTEILSIEQKHMSTYYSEELLNNIGFNYDNTIYGDAVYETSYRAARYDGVSWIDNTNSSWFTDISYNLYLGRPWFARGVFF